MAKSKAQRMREYRERKKEQLGDKWLKSERRRVRGYFVPMAELNGEKQMKIREQNKIRQARYRNKKKRSDNSEVAASRMITDESNEVQPSTSENTVTSTTNDTILTVKLPFPPRNSKSTSGKKRASRALARSYRTIETLEDKVEDLQRKLKNAQRRLQRLDQKKTPDTPKSKADYLLKQSGLKPVQVPEIRKKLIYSECLSAEIKSAKDAQKKSSKQAEVVHKIASGKVMKKYRMKSTLEKMTNLNRRKSCSNKSVIPEKKRRLQDYRKRITDEIVQFLERDDNSRQLPGKGDAVKIDKAKKQKRVLNDYLYNLHLKFLAESPVKISRASFYKTRPKHISLVNFTSRSVCLCSKHQNYCFLLRSLKSMNVTTCTSPDKFVEMYKDTPECLQELLQKVPENAGDIKFQQWKKVKLTNGKERQRVVEVQKERSAFIEMMTTTFDEFKSHIERVKQQYSAVKNMKDKLPQGHILIQMDFSENYTCNTLEEIQSAYWNNCMITLHPVVIYYRGDDNELKHTSYVYVSEVLSHNAAMVMSIIDKIIGVVKTLVLSVDCVHFWTDSPSSQYRNKTIFDMISKFPNLYGTLATWHYFECGHGKGPCDGIGGTTKRNADNAVKQGKAMIQDATDFYAWATQNEHGIKYDMITEDEYNKKKEEVDVRNSEIKPLKGSMMLHAIVGGNGDGSLAVRNTSCACNDCFDESSFNVNSQCGWEKCSISEKSRKVIINDEADSRSTGHTELVNKSVAKTAEDKTEALEIATEKFVVARYDDKCYVGKISEICNEDNTVHISFMAECGKVEGRFKWPNVEDNVWINTEDIVKVIADPIATSKTGRMFTFPVDVLQLLNN